MTTVHQQSSDFITPGWPVVYSDNHLLALYKPAGLLIQGDATRDACLLDLAKRWVKKRFNKPGNVFLGLVHRLDRPVAGLVLFARTSKAARRLSEQFRNKTVRKEYLAVVEGEPMKFQGHLTNYLQRGAQGTVRLVPRETCQSRQAQLSYRVVDRQQGRSLIRIRLETGRKHQIRLQLSHLGCPIVGDVRYGATHPLPYRQIALLAWMLTVDHPTMRESMTFCSPIPREWPWSINEPRGPRPPWNWVHLKKRLQAVN